MNQFLKEQKPLLRLLTDEDNVSTFQVFNNLIKNGTPEQIRFLKKVMSPEAFDKAAATFLFDFMEEIPGANPKFKTLRNKLEKGIGKERAMLIVNPEVLEDIGTLLQLGDEAGIPIMSTSRTGSSIAQGNVSLNILKDATNEEILDTMWEVARNKDNALRRGVKQTKPKESIGRRLFKNTLGAPITPARVGFGAARTVPKILNIQDNLERQGVIERRLDNPRR